MSFYQDSTIRFSCRFRDLLSHTDYDPQDITVRIKPEPTTTVPTPTETTYAYGTDPELVRDSLGHYHADFAPDVAGTWLYRWEGEGPEMVITEGKVVVRETFFA